jgi:hypothetical protein
VNQFSKEESAATIKGKIAALEKRVSQWEEKISAAFQSK